MPGTWQSREGLCPIEISNSYGNFPALKQTLVIGCLSIFGCNLPIFVIHCADLDGFRFLSMAGGDMEASSSNN